MKFEKGFYFVLAVMVLLIISCTEFIEPSLTERKMVLLSPSNHLETSQYQQVFWWESMEDAIGYRLQVVTPNFDSSATLVLDTLVRLDKFVHTLDPGRYEWRVRAENGSSSSLYSTFKLTVHPSSLKGQAFQLNSPLTGMITNQATIGFKWPKLFGATTYRLQIDDRAFVDTTKIMLDLSLTDLSYSFKPLFEGSYQFRMRAENATENSKWSTVGTLVYDATGPEKVALELPVNQQTVSLPVSLKWASIRDANSYQLFVYKSDSVSLFSGDYPKILTSNTHSFPSGSSGDKLVWRVRATDRAGNYGSFSDYRSFFIP